MKEVDDDLVGGVRDLPDRVDLRADSVRILVYGRQDLVHTPRFRAYPIMVTGDPRRVGFRDPKTRSPSTTDPPVPDSVRERIERPSILWTRRDQ
ncbi:hypothetical protein GCM10008992_08550 [Halorubrum aquaticum]